jgi:prephenate dehydrogenase
MSVLFQNALVIGLGVIGGSVASGLKKYGIANKVVGYALEADMQAALKANAVDLAVAKEADLAVAIANADLLVLALPVHLCVALLPQIEMHMRPDAVLTDVCSVKKIIADAVALNLVRKAGQFIAAHPIAGSHLSGFEGANADLFNGAAVILAPSTNEDAFDKVRQLWLALGAEIEVMSNELHDERYANLSHLPHAVAFALANTVLALTEKHQGDLNNLSSQVGKGFLDTTRIAASSAELWAGISIANRNALLSSLDEFIVQISNVRNAIDGSDVQALGACFERASEFRRRFDSKPS